MSCSQSPLVQVFPWSHVSSSLLPGAECPLLGRSCTSLPRPCLSIKQMLFLLLSSIHICTCAHFCVYPPFPLCLSRETLLVLLSGLCSRNLCLIIQPVAFLFSLLLSSRPTHATLFFQLEINHLPWKSCVHIPLYIF